MALYKFTVIIYPDTLPPSLSLLHYCSKLLFSSCLKLTPTNHVISSRKFKIYNYVIKSLRFFLIENAFYLF